MDNNDEDLVEVWYADYEDATYEDGLCVNNKTIPEGRTTYSSQLKCCQSAFGAQSHHTCIENMPNAPTQSPTAKVGSETGIWYPSLLTDANYEEGSCSNTAPVPMGVETFWSQELCCLGVYGSQSQHYCLDQLPSDAPSSSPSEDPTILPTSSINIITAAPTVAPYKTTSTVSSPPTHNYHAVFVNDTTVPPSQTPQFVTVSLPAIALTIHTSVGLGNVDDSAISSIFSEYLMNHMSAESENKERIHDVDLDAEIYSRAGSTTESTYEYILTGSSRFVREGDTSTLEEDVESVLINTFERDSSDTTLLEMLQASEDAILSSTDEISISLLRQIEREYSVNAGNSSEQPPSADGMPVLPIILCICGIAFFLVAVSFYNRKQLTRAQEEMNSSRDDVSDISASLADSDDQPIADTDDKPAQRRKSRSKFFDRRRRSNANDENGMLDDIHQAVIDIMNNPSDEMSNITHDMPNNECALFSRCGPLFGNRSEDEENFGDGALPGDIINAGNETGMAEIKKVVREEASGGTAEWVCVDGQVIERKKTSQ